MQICYDRANSFGWIVVVGTGRARESLSGLQCDNGEWAELKCTGLYVGAGGKVISGRVKVYWTVRWCRW
jgi:hypothetical protein